MASGSTRLGALSLRTNFAWTFLGTGVYSAARWLTVSILAKLVTPGVVGQYALAIAVVTPVFVLSNMELRLIQATDAKREHLFRDYIALRGATTLFALAACAVVACVIRPEIRMLIILMSMCQAVEALADIIFGLFQLDERMDRIARSMMLRGPARLVCLGVVLYVTRDVVLGTLAELGATATVLLLHDVPMAARLLRSHERELSVGDGILPRWVTSELRRMVRVSLPLAGLVSVLAIQAQLPRYFVESFSGTRELGIFAAIATLGAVGTPVWTALAQAATPRLARHWFASELKQFWRLRRRLMGVAALLGGGGLAVVSVAGARLLRFFYTADYATHAQLLVWTTAAAGVGYLSNVLGVSLSSTRRLAAQFRVQLAVTVLTLPMYYLAAEKFGATGVAGTLLAQNVMQLATYAAITFRGDRIGLAT